MHIIFIIQESWKFRRDGKLTKAVIMSTPYSPWKGMRPVSTKDIPALNETPLKMLQERYAGGLNELCDRRCPHKHTSPIIIID
jgi:hypothetical protein